MRDNMLVIELNYTKRLSAVLPHLESHRAFLKAQYEKGYFVASGPKSPRTGGMIIALISKDEAEDLVKQDPFYIHNLAKYRIKEFSPVLHHPALKSLLLEHDHLA